MSEGTRQVSITLKMLTGQVWVDYSPRQVQLATHSLSIYCIPNTRRQDLSVCNLPEVI